MAAPSRVLLVVAHGGAGGMQTQVGLLARGLREAGCDVVIGAGPGHLSVGDVRVEALPVLTAGSSVGFARAMRSLVDRVDAHVVHGHGLRLAPFLAASAPRRCLVTCHGIEPARARRTASMVRLTRVPVASCGEGPRRLLAAAGVRSRVLDNAVPEMPSARPRAEVAARFGLDPQCALVVSPARLTPQKDPLALVRALARAPGLAAVLAGGGPLEHDVRTEIARCGVAGRVVVEPWLDDARSLIASADILALASRWEGQPTVVLEAMAAGVAVVATSCTGTADTVVDGVTGLLAEVGDTASLGGALSRAARDPVLRGELAGAARLTASQHALDVVVAAHLDAYDRVLAGRWT